MAFRLEDVQAALADDGLDGWLLYDFHGSNPIARSLAGLNGGGKMTTRRWFYLIPAHGTPRALVHAIEPHTLVAPARRDPPLRRPRRAVARARHAAGAASARVAMEYSPGNAIPYIARVDAGTVEAVRKRGVTRRLLGRPGAALRGRVEPGAARDAPGGLGGALPDQGPHVCRHRRARSARGATFTEYDVQQWMAGWFREEGLVERRPAGRRRRWRTRATRTTCRSRARAASSAATISSCSICGASSTARRRVRRHHLGLSHRRGRPRRAGAGLCRDRRRPRRGAGADRGSARAGRGPARLAGGPGRAARADRRRLCRPASSTARATAWASRCTATASTWTTTRRTTIGACCPAPGSRSSRACISRHFGVRTEINVFYDAGEARASGPRQAAIIALG